MHKLVSPGGIFCS